MKFVKPGRLWLKDHAELGEKWVQERIADDPALLGLGNLVLKDKERAQPHAGRLDLLLQDPDTDRRFEVEVQLGRTDEGHIIRTLEYWDIERKRYPQYDHCGVLVAEDITSRFLNVIGLFNSSVPLIAIQMSALSLDDQVALVFTTVLDEFTRGHVDEDEETHEVADRAYWEARAGKESMAMVDPFLEIARESDRGLELKYNKFYIGLAKNGAPNNFVLFRPSKSASRVEARLEQSPDLEKVIEDAALDLMDYDKRWRRYRIRLAHSDLTKKRDALAEVFRRAYTYSQA